MKSRFNFGSCHLSRGSELRKKNPLSTHAFCKPASERDKVCASQAVQRLRTKLRIQRIRMHTEDVVYFSYIAYSKRPRPKQGCRVDTEGYLTFRVMCLQLPVKHVGPKPCCIHRFGLLKNIRFIGNIPEQYRIFILVTMSKLAHKPHLSPEHERIFIRVAP